MKYLNGVLLLSVGILASVSASASTDFNPESVAGFYKVKDASCLGYYANLAWKTVQVSTRVEQDVHVIDIDTILESSFVVADYSNSTTYVGLNYSTNAGASGSVSYNIFTNSYTVENCTSSVSLAYFPPRYQWHCSKLKVYKDGSLEVKIIDRYDGQEKDCLLIRQK